VCLFDHSRYYLAGLCGKLGAVCGLIVHHTPPIVAIQEALPGGALSLLADDTEITQLGHRLLPGQPVTGHALLTSCHVDVETLKTQSLPA
jgi:hypothetical protein